MYIKAGRDYFRLHSRSKSLERYEEDSIITKLSLTTLYQGYKNTNEEGVKIDAINNVAEILYFTGSLNDSKELYNSAILLNKEMDERKCLSLYGYIRCHYSGISEIDYETAVNILPYYENMAAIYSKIYDDNAYGVYNLYAELGYISYIAKEDDFYKYCIHAIQIAKEAKIEWEITLGSILTDMGYIKHPNVVLGDYYRYLGEYNQAVDCYLSVGIVDEDSFIDIYPCEIYSHIADLENVDLPIYKGSVVYPKNILKLADIYCILGRPVYSQYMSDAFYCIVKNLLYIFNNYDSDVRSVYANLYSPLLTILYSHPDPKWVYNVALFTKGVTNNVDISLREACTHNGIVDERYNKYLKLKDAYSKNPSETTKHLMRLCETNLLKFSFLHQEYLKHLMYTYLDVYNHICIDSKIAIEFLKITPFANQELKYIALLLAPFTEVPLQIEICTANKMEALYKSTLHKSAEQSNLYNLIWSKLEPYINEGDDVYFAPDGLLYQMNIEVLHDADGRRANEKWNLHRVSLTRELCMEKPKIEMSSAALYGGLIYDVTENDMLAQSRAYAKESGEVATRGFIADSTMRAGWKYLDGSRSEVEAIAEMCQSQNIETKVYTTIAGNEESFKDLSGKKTPIIHLATHGFFYKNEEVEHKPFFESIHLREQQIRPDNSLKRSGLILAGAQKAWLGEPIPEEVEDGILLAEEIATMDLTGTDLVVLSACETGLGEITSEGVFGLQRAFKKAGVQTIIMSLWTVDDSATSLFMQTFYKHWLDGKSKHEAFAIAQQTVREDKDFSDPKYWAGFIMLD